MTEDLASRTNERARFELALASTRLGLWDWNMITGETVFNERWAEILGYQLAELSPTTIETWTSLAHPDDLAHSAAEIERHAQGLIPFYDVEVRMRHHDGRWVWVHDRGQIVEWTPDGQPQRMIGTHEDADARITAQTELAASERRFVAMFRDHDAVMLLVDPDTGQIVDANHSAARFYGYSIDDLRRMQIDQINTLPPEEAARRRQQALNHTLQSFVFPHRLADGQIRLVEVHSSPIEDHGRTLLFSIIHDVTDREALEALQRQAAAVFDHISDAVIIADPRGIVMRVNPAFTRITGLAPEDIIGSDTRSIAAPIEDPERRQEVRETHRRAEGFRAELVVRHADGSEFPCIISASPILGSMGDIDGYVTLVTDIRDRVRAEQDNISFVTRHDPVTGLPNRVWFAEALDDRLDQLRSAGTYATLLLIDLDRFQVLNDSYGREAGDGVLADIAGRLAARMRPQDLLAATQGNEFAVLLDGISDIPEAGRAAERMLEAIVAPAPLPDGTEATTSACIGVKVIPGSSRTAEEVMQSAEAALHLAKRVGPGTIRHHSQMLVPATRKRVALEMRLWRAWEKREFTVYYQPQIDITTGSVVGAEALIRWFPEDGPPVPPAEFIPVAEEIGLIADLGRWVLSHTCQQGAIWAAAGQPPITLAVNVAAAQFAYGTLATDIDQALAATGFPAERLELELTESGLFGIGPDTVAELDAVRSRGVRLSIDDFGTGYSSLSYLTRLPLTGLKIDRSFVSGLGSDPSALTVASTIVSMGHALGLTILAEGVETEEQRLLLRELGCDLFQGYLVSPPVSALEFATLLRASL
jgi:diguanylate cyclase (GGDEF)-like protein/PAS domain S-box-containing protein